MHKSHPLPQDADLITMLEPGVLSAGRLIMDAFVNGCPVEEKDDHSPVTWADREAERIILEALAKTCPDIPVVAEEAVSAGHLPDALGDAFFLVDPLDGTREFVNKREDFTVNVALVRNGVPVVGLVYAPAKHLLFTGRPGHAEIVQTDRDHKLGPRRQAHVRVPGEVPIVVASRSHRTRETDEYIARLHQAEILSVGSSLKFCMVASGRADLYPRFGPTMQWDTAAGDAVLRAAGGRTLKQDGAPLTYGCDGPVTVAGFANPWFISDGGAVV